MSDKVGFPQLDFTTYPSQIFWLAITFSLMYFVMSKIVIPPIKELIDTRNSIRKSDLDKAEKYSDETQTIRESYETALETARVTAAHTLVSTEKTIKLDIEKSREEFTKRLENELNEAEIRINSMKDKYLESIGDISAEIALNMIHKVANVKVSNNDIKKTVDRIMSKREAE